MVRSKKRRHIPDAPLQSQANVLLLEGSYSYTSCINHPLA